MLASIPFSFDAYLDTPTLKGVGVSNPEDDYHMALSHTLLAGPGRKRAKDGAGSKVGHTK